MKSISEIRRTNLIYLRNNMFNGSQADLATAIDKQPNVISRSINPQSKDYRNIGNRLAREIEEKLELADNWMDVERSDKYSFGSDDNPDSEINHLGSSVGEPQRSYNILDLDTIEWIQKTMNQILDIRIGDYRKAPAEAREDLYADLAKAYIRDSQIKTLKLETLISLLEKEDS